MIKYYFLNFFSGGQRRKISVAAALLAQNSLIILDEPTAGIDPVVSVLIISLIIQKCKSIVQKNI